MIIKGLSIELKYMFRGLSWLIQIYHMVDIMEQGTHIVHHDLWGWTWEHSTCFLIQIAFQTFNIHSLEIKFKGNYKRVLSTSFFNQYNLEHIRFQSSIALSVPLFIVTLWHICTDEYVWPFYSSRLIHIAYRWIHT